MSIEVRNLTKLYGEQKAVDHISFTIGKQEIAGFIGPNGAGKSTTMKILTGIIPASSGEAFLMGVDIVKNPLEIRKLIGYLPENNPLYPEMYVREYLEYVVGLYKNFSEKGKKRKLQEKESIKKVIDITGLGPEQHKKIHALSKGYRQRVGLAQAIVHNPEILILDEPTSGLDPGQIIEIRNLILELGKEKTVLLSTHLMQEVEAICSRVIMINKGKIVADGSQGEIHKRNHSELVTILLELDKNTDIRKIEEIEGVIRCVELKDLRYLIESDLRADIRPLIFQFAVNNEITILSLQKKEKSLEELFRELTD